MVVSYLTLSDISRVVVFIATWTETSNEKENTPDVSTSEARIHIPYVPTSESLIPPSEGDVYPSGVIYGCKGNGVAL